jgi:hypothetical protein
MCAYVGKEKPLKSFQELLSHSISNLHGSFLKLSKIKFVRFMNMVGWGDERETFLHMAIRKYILKSQEIFRQKSPHLLGNFVTQCRMKCDIHDPWGRMGTLFLYIFKYEIKSFS